MNIIYLISCKSLRRWIGKLASYLPAEKREELKKRNAENGYEMVNKYVDGAGVTRVWGAYIINKNVEGLHPEILI